MTIQTVIVQTIWFRLLNDKNFLQRQKHKNANAFFYYAAYINVLVRSC
jgi:hypothetical protein